MASKHCVASIATNMGKVETSSHIAQSRFIISTNKTVGIPIKDLNKIDLNTPQKIKQTYL